MARGRSFLFLGPELGQKLDAVEDLRRELRTAGTAPEESSFYAGETAVTDMAAVLRNGSLFAESRLIFIKNAEALKKKEDIDLLASYIEKPQDDTTLILLSDATSLAKGLEKAAGENKRIFWELLADQKNRWVSAFFKREGYRVSEDGVAAVLELVENNTEALRRECSRLLPFLKKDEPAGAEEVSRWLAHTREESSFTLFSRIAEGDLTRALETQHTLAAAKTASPAILAALAWCFRKLRDYLTLEGTGTADRGEYKRLGFASPQARRDYSLAASRYPRPDACLALIADFDVLIRSAGSAPEPILMDLFLYKLMTAPEQPRAKWFYPC